MSIIDSDRIYQQNFSAACRRSALNASAQIASRWCQQPTGSTMLQGKNETVAVSTAGEQIKQHILCTFTVWENALCWNSENLTEQSISKELDWSYGDRVAYWMGPSNTTPVASLARLIAYTLQGLTLPIKDITDLTENPTRWTTLPSWSVLLPKYITTVLSWNPLLCFTTSTS